MNRNATEITKSVAVATRECSTCSARPGVNCRKVQPKISGRRAQVRLSISATHAARLV